MSKIQAWGHRLHYRICLNDNKTKLCIISSPTIEIRRKKHERTIIDAVADFFRF